MKPETLVRDSYIGEDTAVTCTFTYWPFIPGRLSGPPEDCFPDEGGEVELEKVMLGEFDVSDLLSSADMERLTERLQEKMAEDE